MSSKLREALEKCTNYLNGDDVGLCKDECDAMREVMQEALAEPVRNCDVGTIKEQSDRFADFCRKHSKGCGLGYGSKGIGHPKVTCPAFKDMECSIVWSQMPYEEVK